MKILIGNKQYNVTEAKTPEERKKGLQGVEKLPKYDGMLFYFNPDEYNAMWMKDVKIPLDIIFINDDLEVIGVHKGIPGSEKLISYKNTAYVLEVNADSGVKKGDELDFVESESGPVMKVLFPDGSDQYLLWGGERIFSRINTRVIIKKAKKAEETKDDKDYKALGRYIFKCIKTLDERPKDYVLN